MSYLLHSSRLPWPASWKEVFGRQAPLLIEIGFGGADFLLELGRQRSDCNVLGVEISVYSLKRGLKKLTRARLSNVRLLQGSAHVVLQALCQPSSIDSIYINFPDPWPKAAHTQRRLINPGFLQLAANRVKSGGLLEIATDHAEYAQVITDELKACAYFESRQTTAFVTQDNERIRTKYEQIAHEEGRTCHYFKWVRNQVLAPDLFPIPEEQPMPHVILTSPLSLTEIAGQFEPMETSASSTHVKLTELFQSGYDQKLLVEVYVNEEPMPQRVGLTIRRRKTGELIVGLHEIGFPRPTPGIQLAIDCLANWVISLHPQAEVLQSNLRLPAEREVGQNAA